MKHLISCLALSCCAVFAQQGSPVDGRIAAARAEIKLNPASADAFNHLAFALIRKGRDFGEPALYAEAGKALDQSLRLAPASFEAQKLRVAILLGVQRSADALKLALPLNHKVPDDIAVWALMTDAQMQLGNYAEAERDAQWVLDLRPGSSLGFEKAALLRELFGDWEGAIEFLDEANRRTAPSDADQKSWLLTQKARLVLAGGNAEAAALILNEAVRLFPDSQLAAGGLARVRLTEGNNAEALRLLEARYQRVPNDANLYDWAEALALAGHAAEAAQRFAAFEKQASARDDATLQMIGYYCDTKPEPARALALASRAALERHDSATLAAYAWALYRSERFADAKIQMDQALAVGVRDAVYFCHAASIAARLNDSAGVERYSRALSGMPKGSCPVSAAVKPRAR